LTKIEKSIEIAVPISQVWAYITDPQNFLLWSGTLDSLEVIHETTDGIGTRARATLGQMTFIIEVIELVEQQKLVAQAVDGDLKSLRQAFHLEGNNTRTHLTYLLEYTVPTILGGPITDRLLVRHTIADEMAKGLHRLKHQLEATWRLLSNAQQP
jgi:uncharacterized membrane protein